MTYHTTSSTTQNINEVKALKLTAEEIFLEYHTEDITLILISLNASQWLFLSVRKPDSKFCNLDIWAHCLYSGPWEISRVIFLLTLGTGYYILTVRYWSRGTLTMTSHLGCSSQHRLPRATEIPQDDAGKGDLEAGNHKKEGWITFTETWEALVFTT